MGIYTYIRTPHTSQQLAETNPSSCSLVSDGLSRLLLALADKVGRMLHVVLNDVNQFSLITGGRGGAGRKTEGEEG